MVKRFETFTVLINRINRNIRKIKNHEMAEYNLRGTHVSCIYHLFLTDGLAATDLCERCEEDKATVSRALDYLETNGYITCNAKGTKRYKSPLSLTAKGKEVGEKIAGKVDNVLKEIGSCLTEDERKAFYHSLFAISEGLERISNEN